MPKVFISYAHSDRDRAQRAFDDLLAMDGVEPWLDVNSLTPGMKWRPAIRKAIRESDYFIALLSIISTTGRGYRHSELNQALEILKEFPEDHIFLIPVRLEN